MDLPRQRVRWARGPHGIPHSAAASAMLVLAPRVALEARWTHVVGAALALAVSVVAVKVGKSVSKKIRISKRIDPSIPGPKGYFLLGLAPTFYKNLHRLYDYQAEMLALYGGRFREPWGLLTNNVVFISDPADVEHVTSANVDNYIKPVEFTSSLGEIFTPTLLGLNHAHSADGGARFRLQRKLIARVFTANHFREFTRDVFHKHALRTIDVIMANDGKCNMHDVASMFTLQTIFDIGLGLSLQDYDERLGLTFARSMDHIFLDVAARLIYKPYWRYLWWCMPGEYRLKRECRVLLDLIDGIICDRLAESPEQFDARSDILSMCIRKARELEAASVDGENLLDRKTLLSCVTGLLFGGRDTISSSLLYAFYNLAQYPEEQDKILAELETIDIEKLTYEDVKSLKYLDAFVWEVLRLHPVTPISQRQAAEDDVLPDGTFIPAGTDIFWSAYYMGRNNAALWGDDQAAFRPTRWLEMKKRPTSYEHPVFQAGLRMCPGMNMALLESKVFIAIMLTKFKVRIQDGEQVKDRPYEIALAMHMKGGLPLQFTPRT